MTMRDAAQIVLLLVVLSDLAILGTSRLSSCIRGLAAQGFLLGLLPVLIAPHVSVHAASLAVGTVIVKAVALPGTWDYSAGTPTGGSWTPSDSLFTSCASGVRNCSM